MGSFSRPRVFDPLTLRSSTVSTRPPGRSSKLANRPAIEKWTASDMKLYESLCSPAPSLVAWTSTSCTTGCWRTCGCP